MPHSRARRMRSVICLAVLLAVAVPASGGAPQGEPRSVDPVVSEPLLSALERRGYVPKNRAGALNVAIAAYLWENRQRLASLDVPRHREVDLVVCLLGRDEGEFARLAEPIASWCTTAARSR
jgi:hypothetical protein